MEQALKTRIQTALIVALPVILALISGGILLKLLVLCVYVALNWEMLSMSADMSKPQRQTSLLVLLLLPGGYWVAGLDGWVMGFFLATVLLFSLQVLNIERDKHDYNQSNSLCALALALGYTGLLGSLLFIAVDLIETSRLFWLILCVVAADTAAYFTGRALGGAKLSPRISPNKTVSGAIGGMIAAGLISVLLTKAFGFREHSSAAFGLGIVISVLAIFGDLFESLIKRVYGKKDSGELLPGHGGFLDRLDALLFAAPILFFIGLN
jgi:phosphatidate cytidylyltransferase